MLRQRAPRRRLLEALDGVGRLVLLGDVLELVQRRAQRALAVGEPLLRDVAARLDGGCEVVIVPGNHDRALVRPWIRAHGREMGAENSLPPDVTPALRRVASWLGADRVRVSYPGVWLRDDIWATHGHYLDRHLFPESTYGVARGLLSQPPSDTAAPAEYEKLRRPSVTGASSWMPAQVSRVVDGLAASLRAATMPQVQRHLVRPRFAPLNSMLLGLQMQHASMPALARVVHRLEVEAEWVVFGHVHRLGPLAGDDLDEWRGPGGSPRMVNTGSWLYEPRLVDGAVPPHPYWPGGAVVIDDGSDPRAVSLLDDLGPAALRRAG